MNYQEKARELACHLGHHDPLSYEPITTALLSAYEEANAIHAIENLCLTIKGHHTCSYCGWVGRGNLNINQSREAIIEHVKTCDKHPLQGEIATLTNLLRRAKVSAVGDEVVLRFSPSDALEITAVLEGKPAGRDAEGLLKEADGVLEKFEDKESFGCDFLGFGRHSPDCRTCAAAALRAKIGEVGR